MHWTTYRPTGYDALVLDIMMPGKDGIEVLKAARGSGNTTPALFLTAKAEVADRVAGLDAGADDYLPKPFAASEFLARIPALCVAAEGVRCTGRLGKMHRRRFYHA